MLRPEEEESLTRKALPTTFTFEEPETSSHNADSFRHEEVLVFFSFRLAEGSIRLDGYN